MPYNNQFYKMLGSSITETSGLCLVKRLKATLLQTLARTKPPQDEVIAFVTGQSVAGKKGSFAKTIGFNALNILYYPYALSKTLEVLAFSLLDVCPLTADKEMGNSSPDKNYFRIATKFSIQVISFIPMTAFFLLAKVGDLVGYGVAAISNKIDAFFPKKYEINETELIEMQEIPKDETFEWVQNPLFRLGGSQPENGPTTKTLTLSYTTEGDTETSTSSENEIKEEESASFQP